MELPPARLEDWLRSRYFEAKIDISSSGVEPYSFAEMRSIVGLALDELENISFHDSPTLGARELRAAIAARWGDGDPDRVLVANGSNEVLFLVMHATLSPGDEVVAVEPGYHTLWGVAQALGCRVVPWRLGLDVNGATGRPNLEQLRALVSPRTRMVVANYPHNPTGVSLSRAEQRFLIDICAEADTYLCWDAAFAELTHDGPPLPDPSLQYEHAVSFGTLSKGYGLPGLRVGWCLAAPETLAACMRIRDYTTLALSPLVELVATRAVQHAGRLLAPRLAQARRNRDLLDAWVERNQRCVSWVRPDGGVVAFPRLRHLKRTDGFCQRLMDEHGVLLVPGSCFDRPQHVRLGFGGPTAELEAGLARVSALFAAEGVPA
ncbi:MAG: capreomycidine synthase [Nocardioidaceae bacterium]